MISKEQVLAGKSWSSEYPNYMAENEILDAMEEYADVKSKETAIDFGKWVSHEDWVYLPSKGYWVNEEQEENTQPLSDQQIYDLYLECKASTLPMRNKP